MESSIREITGKIETIIFNEKTQQISIFLNKINYTINIEKDFYFKSGDNVKIIFDERLSEVYAVLKIENSLLYLNKEIYSINSKKLNHRLQKIWFFTSWVIFILVAELIIYQWLVDGTVYYFDIAKYVLVVLIFPIFFSAIFVIDRKISQYFKYSEEVFSKLNLPYLEQEQLQYLRMTNSYFEVIPNLYFMEHVSNIVKKYNSYHIKPLIDQICLKRNRGNLTDFQKLKFKLKLKKGKIQDVNKLQIPKDSIHTDPFLEVTATLNGLPIYGYFDEFDVKNGQIIEVVLSKFADEKGYYIWALYDGERYLYLDEDQPMTYNQKFGWIEAIIIIIFMGFILLFFWFILFVDDNFIFATYLYFAVMLFISSYLIAIVYFMSRFDTESKTGFYVYRQLQNLLKLPQNINLHDLNFCKLDRENKYKTEKSRTGYDLKKTKSE